MSYNIKNNIIRLIEFMKHNVFIIATGRSYLDFMKKKTLYNINYQYLIINHGSTIIFGDKVIYNNIIKKEVLKDLLFDLNKEKIVYSFGCNKKNSRLNIKNISLTKIYVRYQNRLVANKIYTLLKEKYRKYINCFFVSNSEAIEIVSTESNKMKAIDYLITQFNLNKEDIYTIGDDYTDIDMLTEFKGYIMKNSQIKKNLHNIPCVNSIIDLMNIIEGK